MIIKDEIMSDGKGADGKGAYGDGLDGSGIIIANFSDVGKKTCAREPALIFPGFSLMFPGFS